MRPKSSRSWALSFLASSSVVSRSVTLRHGCASFGWFGIPRFRLTRTGAPLGEPVRDVTSERELSATLGKGKYGDGHSASGTRLPESIGRRITQAGP